VAVAVVVVVKRRPPVARRVSPLPPEATIFQIRRRAV
jgi:hypothetical protein